MSEDARCLVLRLAGPLQAWGSQSQFNRRETASAPTKSGLVGLLAAADGRRREDPIVDLVRLRLGVRVDQEGSLLRDYHTVSDYRGQPLLSAKVSGKGLQKATSPPKHTAVTQRFYLQDAVFVAVLEGDSQLLEGLALAVRQPGFPLALGRRSCVPTQPLLVTPNEGAGPLWGGTADDVLARVPWQASHHHRQRHMRGSPNVDLAVTVDAADGSDVLTDVPKSFSQKSRGFVTRRVRHDWVRLPTGSPADESRSDEGAHDPFALLGW